MTTGLTSQYQSMYSQQLGFSQQLSGYGMASPYGGNPLQANNMMLTGMRGAGHAGNAAMTIGGIGAGMAGTAAFGLVGGTGIGLGVMAAGAAVGHAGHHMYEGAQQQAALNQQLRSSFGFRNAQGGHGFSGGDSFDHTTRGPRM